MHPDGYIDKCTFCHHRVDKGLDPACVSSCPTQCMHFGLLDDPHSKVNHLLKTREHKVLIPETGNDPNVFYLI
jgi:Fe-S-cluster-containing dehydrogenase component